MGSPESSIRRVNLESEQCGDERAQSKSVTNLRSMQQSINSLETSSPLADTNPPPTLSNLQHADSSILNNSVLTDDSDRFADADKDEYVQHDSDEPV